jgi:hypothetical protein
MRYGRRSIWFKMFTLVLLPLWVSGLLGAAEITDPNSGASFYYMINVPVSGFVTENMTTYTVRATRMSTGTIMSTLNFFAMTNGFDVVLTKPSPNWFTDTHCIEVRLGTSSLDYVTVGFSDT